MTDEVLKQASKELLEYFPDIRNLEFFKYELQIDPELQLAYSLYSGFFSEVISPLLRSESVNGFSIERIVEFINTIFNHNGVDIVFLDVLVIEWLQPMASLILHPQEGYDTNKLLSVKSSLSGKALDEFKFELNEGPAPKLSAQG